jgi:processive 1,2-diacylglycerol beta-glucosyltransferase
LIIGKAGASSAMEALCMGRPFLFTDWIAQNDLAIIRFFEKNGYGWYVPSARGATDRLGRFLERPDADDAPAAAAVRIRAGGFASGVDAAAQALALLAETP